MDENAERMQELGPRWFEVLALPKALMSEMTAAVDASQQEARDKRQREREAEEAQRVELAKPAAKVNAELTIAKPWPWCEGELIRLYDEKQLRAAYTKMQRVATADREKTKNRLTTIEHIAARGAFRKCGIPVNWAARLNVLRESFANFIPVIDVIDAELTLAATSSNDQPVAIPPLLLNGPPGCGKTYFAEHLAKLFDTSFLRISMETAQSSSDLSGSAEFWGNTQPGRLFDQLIDRDHINPVVLLDEVDKAGGSENYRADKPLYTLLERETARRWSDLSFPSLQLDASHVIWVLTSNDARNIAAPLRSRMQCFDIAPLDAAAARRLVRSLYRQEVAKHPQLGLEPELAIAHCDVMRAFSPREVVRMCRALVARLAGAERRHVTLDDLKAVGALDGQLVDFERHVRLLERYLGASLEWPRQ